MNDPLPEAAACRVRRTGRLGSLELQHVTEEIYGLLQGDVWLRDGVVLTGASLYYLSQRLKTPACWEYRGDEGRVYRRRRIPVSAVRFGASDAAVATPPRGTRFNYLALGGGGVLVSVKPRVHLIATLELMHISNANLKGPDRNPDIEAIGPSLGVIIGFN